MKLNSIRIEGFRGCRVPFEVELDGKSLFIFAENGFGKTTIVDAVEFWSTGDVAGFHREGYQLDAVINVDVKDATVVCTTSEGTTWARTINRATGKPKITSSIGHNNAAIPILRHSTMAQFMSKTAGDKKKQLMELLGLQELIEFRDTLRRACGTATRIFEEAEDRWKGEVTALSTKCGNVSLLDLAERLRVEANLSTPITTMEDLQRINLEPITHKDVDREHLVAELDRVRDVSRLINTVTEWNQVQEDTAQTQSLLINELLMAGKNVIDVWPEDTCPLCRQPIDRQTLIEQLESRLEDLSQSRLRQSGLRSELERAAKHINKLRTTIEDIKNHPPAGGWPVSIGLDLRLVEIDRLQEDISTSTKHLRAISMPELRLPGSTELLSAIRASAKEDHRLEALSSLISLRDQHLRERQALAERKAAQQVSTQYQAVLELTDNQIKDQIENAIQGLGKLTSSYYGMLTSTPVYDDIAIKYIDERSGGIEFSLLFDKRHRVTPPQRVMSESQLNSLGLALFLARMKDGETEWHTFVLDDVVNSFDADHRLGLANLLAQEFSDWQIVMTSHDRYFQTVCRDRLPKWRRVSIAAWTAQGGPVLSDGDPLQLLERRLAEGRAASELGGLARFALEHALAVPTEKLEISLPYRRNGQYSARDLLDALKAAVRKRREQLAAAYLVLERMSVAPYVTNLVSHAREVDSLPPRADLLTLVKDLHDLLDGFTCSSCGKPVWTFHNGHFQCGCSQLAF